MTKKYGLNMLVTNDPEVKSHMREILKQVEGNSHTGRYPPEVLAHMKRFDRNLSSSLNTGSSLTAASFVTTIAII
jgi:hypothetical protein